MEKYDFSDEILISEEFNLMRKLQSCNSNVVHENDQIFLNGTFYNYCDNSEEMKEYRENQRKTFVESVSNIILKRYPDLNEKQIKQIAIKCSAHPQENQEDILLDIDICTLQFIEKNQLSNNVKKCLENIKESTSKITKHEFNIEIYSEEYAKFFIINQLNKHIQDNSNPLLTWGEGRLVAEMNAEFVKQKEASRVF